MEQFKGETQNWSRLDKYGDFYHTTSWDHGPDNFYMYESCYIYVSSSRKLEQAKKHKTRDESTSSTMEDEKQQKKPEQEKTIPAKRLHSSMSGPLHDKSKCVWCMKREDPKHPTRAHGKLLRISTYRSFKLHTVYTEDQDMKERITRLVESTAALSDTFVADIYYHHSCWLTYVNYKDSSLENMHHQNVRMSDARILFFKHVESVIFKEHEIRSLQSLVSDYKRIISDYGFVAGDVRSSYVKELLIE